MLAKLRIISAAIAFAMCAPQSGLTSETWQGTWKPDTVTAEGPACKQKWTCANPADKTYDEAAYSLQYTPMHDFTVGVCVASGCSKCAAEAPPEPCMVTLKKK